MKKTIKKERYYCNWCGKRLKRNSTGVIWTDETLHFCGIKHLKLWRVNQGLNPLPMSPTLPIQHAPNNDTLPEQTQKWYCEHSNNFCSYYKHWMDEKPYKMKYDNLVGQIQGKLQYYESYQHGCPVPVIAEINVLRAILQLTKD